MLRPMASVLLLVAGLIYKNQIVAAVSMMAIGVVLVFVYGMICRDEAMPNWMQKVFEWRPPKPD